MKFSISFLLLALSFTSLTAFSSTENHAHNENSEHDEHEQSISISDDMAKLSNITTAVVASKNIETTLRAYGKIVEDPNEISHIRARYSGSIISVYKNIGDTVTKGDVLALIESNQSLKRYKIIAPINGIVRTRHANAGESAKDQILFTISNDDKLWLELQIFSSQAAMIKVGLSLLISAEELTTESIIEHVLPNNNQQNFMLARAAINNQNHIWSPGYLAQADINIKQTLATIAIDNRALQTIDGNTVVFIKQDQQYKARPITLGQSDKNFSEVLEGLSLGEIYVVENSYLIKADLGKSGAAHAH